MRSLARQRIPRVSPYREPSRRLRRQPASRKIGRIVALAPSSAAFSVAPSTSRVVRANAPRPESTGLLNGCSITFLNALYRWPRRVFDKGFDGLRTERFGFFLQRPSRRHCEPLKNSPPIDFEPIGRCARLEAPATREVSLTWKRRSRAACGIHRVV